jgi:hypothetical protein
VIWPLAKQIAVCCDLPKTEVVSVLDRERVLNWWTGRLSDAELAEYAGMTTRNLQIVLNMRPLRGGISGGGRGSRHTRRVSQQVRNSVAIIQAMNEAGMTFELAANIVGDTPVMASHPSRVVDWGDTFGGVRSLPMFDPKGNWLPTDIVPWHIWERFVFPCYSVDNSNPRPGDLFEIPFEQLELNERGTMVIQRPGMQPETLEIKPLTSRPVYSGEIDPIGLYLYENHRAESLRRFDDHLVIVNGRWVFIKSPNPRPAEAMQQFLAGQFKKGQEVEYDFDPVSVIERDKKTVRVIGWGQDEEEQNRARYHLKNFDSLLDVNLTLSVRKMKRRAYGLPIERPAKPISWSERAKGAQRFAPLTWRSPSPTAASPAPADDDFFRAWTTDEHGNRIRVGLTKAEHDEYEALTARDLADRLHDSFPWSSVEEMNKEKDRWLELHDKHEEARIRRLSQEMKH